MDLETARRLAIEYGLKGPAWALDALIPIADIRRRIKSEGGCGPGKWGDKLIPDTMYGLNMKPACYNHDCAYADADTPQKKYEADCDLFDNCMIIIEKESANWVMVWLRKRRAMKYRLAVGIGGGAFTGD